MLASDDSSFVTGIELFVDGGRAQTRRSVGMAGRDGFAGDRPDRRVNLSAKPDGMNDEVGQGVSVGIAAIP